MKKYQNGGDTGLYPALSVQSLIDLLNLVSCGNTSRPVVIVVDGKKHLLRNMPTGCIGAGNDNELGEYVSIIVESGD